MKLAISNRIMLALIFLGAFAIFGLLAPNISEADSSEVEDFVTRFYRLCLDRNPDKDGLNGWVSALMDGSQTGSGVANGFVFSKEFLAKDLSDAAYLDILYEAFFNRKPDAAGKQGWLDAMQNGASRQEVLNGYIYAIEFKELCDAYGIKAFDGHVTRAQKENVESFVTRFYQLCLNRDPDAGGLDGWTNNLLSRIQCGADVANGFMYSPEFLEKRTSNAEYLTILYDAFFGRKPDKAGWDAWMAELEAGRVRRYVLDGFIYSQEFSGLCLKYGINPFADSSADADGDGYSRDQGDCNDQDPNTYPGADEGKCSDGTDQDCDGYDVICPEDLVDNDEDGYSKFKGDCDDEDATRSPGAQEVCDDGVDQDCDGSDVSCDSDTDGDGLTFKQETVGWEVWPDRFGLGLGAGGSGQSDAYYPVTSDPEKADTDEDGLDDLQEFLIKSDPRMVDTDGDGLTDAEELNRWGTSPLSIDSDGDSRGPDSDLPPEPKLFDAAELKIDLKNDPTHTPGAGATSPVHKDTDGDDWSDYFEIVEAQGKGFNPVIADRPTIGVEVAGPPLITINGSTSSEENWSREVSVTKSESLSESVSNETSRGTETVAEHTIGGGVELGWDGWKFVGHVEGNYSFSHATSNSQSMTWHKEKARSAETIYQEVHGEGGGESVTLDGGSLSLPVDIANNGNIAYRLEYLRVNVLARHLNDSNDYTPVLEVAREFDIPLDLGPGKKYENILMMYSTESPDLVLSLLKNPSGLIFEVSSYTLTDEDGVSFEFREEDIKQKTAMVVIDYGGELPPERYLVAVNPCRNPNLTSGVTMAEVMSNILEIPHETMLVNDASTTYRTLSKVRSVSHDDSRARKWLVAAESASLKAATPPDFDDIVLQAGDSIYLIFIRDEDGDGLSAREEFLNGTKDNNPDTDGDTLTDYQEVREGWTVTVKSHDGDKEPETYTVFSRGNTKDTDDDGISDDEERACGLDPNRSDTDQDRIDDLDEIEGFTIEKDGQTVVQIVPYEGKAILDGGNEILDSDASGTNDVMVVSGPVGGTVDNGAVLILPGSGGSFESTLGGDDYIGAEHVSMACAPSGFATNPLVKDTDGDGFEDGPEKSTALGNPNNPNDGNLQNDEDSDGLYDAVETFGWSRMVNGVNLNFSSDPNNPDSDDDGLLDGEEYKLGSNPRSKDTDGDGLTDDKEVNEYQTNPAKSDTDGDGLNDDLEVNGWLVRVDGVETKRRVYTDPNSENDIDGDELYDYGEWKYRVDPNDNDTDKDGTLDGKELGICARRITNKGGWPALKCRHPGEKDRKITVDLIKVVSSNNCDPWQLHSWDTGNEHRHRFYLRYPNNERSDFDNNVDAGTAHKFNAPYTWVYDEGWGSEWPFIAKYGDEFELSGFFYEMDFWGPLNDLERIDQSLCFGYMCELGIPQWDNGVPIEDLYLPVDDTEPTRFKVDGNLAKDITYRANGKKCGYVDRWPPGDRNVDFNVWMLVKITAE